MATQRPLAYALLGARHLAEMNDDPEYLRGVFDMLADMYPVSRGDGHRARDLYTDAMALGTDERPWNSHAPIQSSDVLAPWEQEHSADGDEPGFPGLSRREYAARMGL